MDTGRHIVAFDQASKEEPPAFLTTKLHEGAEKCNLDYVDSLIKSGHNVNSRDVNGSTPLMLAANCAGRLYKLNNPVFNDTYSTADLERYVWDYVPDNQEQVDILRQSVRISHNSCQPYETVELLLNAGAQLNEARPDGITALHLAIVNDQLDMAKQFVTAGADIEAKTLDGMTPLLLASLRDNFDLIVLLKRCGANMNAVDNSGRNALQLLTATPREANEKSVRILALHKEHINARDEYGFTPIMNAATICDLNTVEVLLELGADPHVASNFEDEPDDSCTVLSILLEDILDGIGGLSKACIEKLVQLGALKSLPTHSGIYIYSTLNNLIMQYPNEFTQLLIAHGFVPKSVKFSISFIGYLGLKLTPLAAALIKDENDDVQLADYLLHKWFLTPDDLVGSKNLKKLSSFLLNIRKISSLRWLNEYMRQPMSLAQLSFTAVSSQLGDMAGREERVRKLNIPRIVKNKLLFKT